MEHGISSNCAAERNENIDEIDDFVNKKFKVYYFEMPIESLYE